MSLIPLPYLFIFSIIFILSIPVISKGKYSCIIEKQNILSAVFVFIVFLGLRGFVFTDWVSYYNIYDKSPTIFDNFGSLTRLIKTSGGMEPGFLLYSMFCKTISANYFFFQFVSALIDIIILYWFFKTYIPDKIIMGFLFFFLFGGLLIEINLLRNAKAIMLFLVSIKYLEKRKIVNYMGINILGMMFHVSSVIYLPMYFILHKKYSKKILLLLFIIGNILFLCSVSWIKHLLLIISPLLGSSRLGALIQGYTSSSLYTSAFGISIGYLERTMSFLLIYCYYDRLCVNKASIIFLNCGFIYWFIFLYCSEMFILLQRIPLLFIFSYWVLYPRLYTVLSNKKKKLMLCAMVIYGVLLFLTYSKESNRYENVIFGHCNYSQKRAIISSELKAWAAQRISNSKK